METEPDRDRLAREIEQMDDEWFDFRVHLGVYLAVNAVLAFVDLYVTGGTDWFYWPLVGWGSGLLVHFLGLRRHERTLRRRAEKAGLSITHLGGRS